MGGFKVSAQMNFIMYTQDQTRVPLPHWWRLFCSEKLFGQLAVNVLCANWKERVVIFALRVKGFNCKVASLKRIWVEG